MVGASGHSLLVASALLSWDSVQRPEAATFAGGCFWCMEPVFDSLPGVLTVTPGYTGGEMANPSYEEVASGTTGHVEAVRVVFDAGKTTYGAILEEYWRNIDPTATNRQFCDVGPQYKTIIFYENEVQRRIAERSREMLEQSGVFDGTILTEIRPATVFYPAEECHQQFYRKNPLRYQLYHTSSGRDVRLRELWGEK